MVMVAMEAADTMVAVVVGEGATEAVEVMVGVAMAVVVEAMAAVDTDHAVELFSKGPINPFTCRQHRLHADGTGSSRG
eukprot:scaffold649309_cov51-Prasinocladus_malaysianus.AAC.1